MGGETLRDGAGAWVLAPIGTPHTFRNPGDTLAHFLATFTPDRYIHYFNEIAEAINTSGQLTPAQGAEIMARYDTDVVEDTTRR